MEEKYDPFHIVSHVWAKFHGLPGHRDAKIEDYSIFIENKSKEKECYIIKAGEEYFLWKKEHPGATWSAVTNPEEFYDRRDSLGTVTIGFKDEPIKINDKTVEPFPNYGLFWHYITKQK
jgi:hypothetical protein